MQGFLRDKIRYRLEDLLQCGCESEPLGELLRQFELDESHTFRLFIKPFMDAWSWDQDRIDRCCTHVIRPDGVLDSFCRYYATGAVQNVANAEGVPPPINTAPPQSAPTTHSARPDRGHPERSSGGPAGGAQSKDDIAGEEPATGP